jgi:hypothetical protein
MIYGSRKNITQGALVALLLKHCIPFGLANAIQVHALACLSVWRAHLAVTLSGAIGIVSLPAVLARLRAFGKIALPDSLRGVCSLSGFIKAVPPCEIGKLGLAGMRAKPFALNVSRVAKLELLSALLTVTCDCLVFHASAFHGDMPMPSLYHKLDRKGTSLASF